MAYGFLCGRDYDTRQFVNKNRSGFDLLQERAKVFRFKPETNGAGPTIGLPAALHLFEDLPFWEKFFDLLELKTQTSVACRDAVPRGKTLAGAEFCAPITALHGHVAYLAARCDHIFLPVYLEAADKPPGLIRKYCYYTQYAPALVSRMEETVRRKCLVPLLDTQAGIFAGLRRLYQALKQVKPGLSFFQVHSAFHQARAFQSRQPGTSARTFSNAALPKTAKSSVVLLGRPYTLFSGAMNKGIPEIFGSLGIRTFSQDMLARDPERVKRIGGLLKAFHWNYAAAILEAAETVASRKGIYPVLVTSFKCSPDSFVTDYFKRILEEAGKPYLILQLDEHDSSVGYETRIEAAVRAFGNHFQGKDPDPRASGSGSKSPHRKQDRRQDPPAPELGPDLLPADRGQSEPARVRCPGVGGEPDPDPEEPAPQHRAMPAAQYHCPGIHGLYRNPSTGTRKNPPLDGGLRDRLQCAALSLLHPEHPGRPRGRAGEGRGLCGEHYLYRSVAAHRGGYVLCLYVRGVHSKNRLPAPTL